VTVFAAADHQVAEVLLRVQPDLGAQRELARERLQPAGRQLHVLATQSVLDICHRHATRGECLAIEPDAHRVPSLPAQRGARNAGHGRDAVHDVTLGVVGDLEQRHGVRGEVQDCDCLAAGVRLGDVRRIGFRRQHCTDARHAIAHVVGGAVQITVDVELDVDGRALVLAARLDLEDALDAGYAIFDRLRDLVFDDLRRSAAVGGRDRHYRPLDIGILANREPLHRHEAEDDQQQADYGCEHRPADRQL
jgi:hypothetical protein